MNKDEIISTESHYEEAVKAIARSEIVLPEFTSMKEVYEYIVSQIKEVAHGDQHVTDEVMAGKLDLLFARYPGLIINLRYYDAGDGQKRHLAPQFHPYQTHVDVSKAEAKIVEGKEYLLPCFVPSPNKIDEDLFEDLVESGNNGGLDNMKRAKEWIAFFELLAGPPITIEDAISWVVNNTNGEEVSYRFYSASGVLHSLYRKEGEFVKAINDLEVGSREETVLQESDYVKN